MFSLQDSGVRILRYKYQGIEAIVSRSSQIGAWGLRGQRFAPPLISVHGKAKDLMLNSIRESENDRRLFSHAGLYTKVRQGYLVQHLLACALPRKVSLAYSSGYPCSLSASMTYCFPPTGDPLLMPLGKGGSPLDPKILAVALLSLSKKAASPFCSPSCLTCTNCFAPASPICSTLSFGVALLPTDSNPTTSACLTTLSRG